MRRALILALAVTGLGAQPASADQSTDWHNTIPPAAQTGSDFIAGGYRHTCAVVKGGWVRCWGSGRNLGLGSKSKGFGKDLGDDEHPSNAPRVKLGAKAKAIAAGGGVTCALQLNELVRCWGGNGKGELGYGHTKNIGDNEHPKSEDPLKLGGKVKAVTSGGHQSCAILKDGSVRCWGENSEGQLGYGNTKPIGDNEAPKKAGPVKLGGKAEAITSGNRHVCAILTDGSVSCWGRNDSGQLGYGNTRTIGDDEDPAEAGAVPLSGEAVAIESEGHFTCAVLFGGTVRCWGQNDRSAGIGYGNTLAIGDDETPDSVAPVSLGEPATAVTVGYAHACARLDNNRALRCWGGASWNGSAGTLGYGNRELIGDDETPDTAGPVPLSGAAAGLASGLDHSCAVMPHGKLRCWGFNHFGQLGYGTKHSIIGDNEVPADFPPVKLGEPIAR